MAISQTAKTIWTKFIANSKEYGRVLDKVGLTLIRSLTDNFSTPANINKLKTS